jgi:hypothetical protein
VGNQGPVRGCLESMACKGTIATLLAALVLMWLNPGGPARNREYAK